MPELPDVELYLSLLAERLIGRKLLGLKTYNPFVLRSVTPTPRDLEGKEITGFRRLGKRIVFEFQDDLFLVVHLMIAGRFRWMESPASQGGDQGDSRDDKNAVKAGGRPGGKLAIAALSFDSGTLFLTEAGSKKRASLAIVQGESALHHHDPGGIDPLGCSADDFIHAVRQENHPIKDTLTDPRLFSGIGNAYSDEILHRAKISPHRLNRTLSDEEILAVYGAVQEILNLWSHRLKEQFKNRFPGAGDITAFHPDFAVHGKFGQPCPVCGKPVQRIVYADNEANYCAQCQNGGKILADRALSRLLKDDFKRNLDD